MDKGSAANSYGFTDPQFVSQYAEGPPRFVLGYHGMQCMTRLLIAELAPEDARVLFVGAGGRLELKAFAQAQPSPDGILTAWTLPPKC